MQIQKCYIQPAFIPLSYKNITAKPPATAAKLIPTAAPPAVDAVAGEEPEVFEPEPVEAALGLELEVLLAGSIVALYDAQVEFGERGQVLSMQMLWS